MRFRRVTGATIAFALGCGTLGAFISENAFVDSAFALPTSANTSTTPYLLGGTASQTGTATQNAAASTEASPEQEPAESGLTVAIESISPAIITSRDQTVTVTANITNSTSDAIDSVNITLLTQTVSMTELSQLHDYLSLDSSPGYVAVEQNIDTAIPSGQSAKVSFEFPAFQLSLNESWDWGTRGITVVASHNDAIGYDRSLFVWDSGIEEKPADLSVVVPWTTHNTNADTLLSEHASRQALLQLANNPAVAIAIDPVAAHPAAYASNEATADAEDNRQSDVIASEPIELSTEERNFWTSFFSANPQVLSLPVLDADLSAVAETNSSSLWSLANETREELPALLGLLEKATQTSSDDSQTTDTEQSADVSDPPQSSSSSTSSSAEASSDAPISSLTHVHPTVVWPSRPIGLPLLQQLGDGIIIDSQYQLRAAVPRHEPLTSRVEVNAVTGETELKSDTPQGILAEGSSDNDEAQLSAQTLTVLVSDPTISELLSWSPDTPEGLLDHRLALAAVSTILARDNHLANRSTLIAFDRSVEINNNLVENINHLLNPRWVNPVGFDEIASSTPTTVARTALPASASTIAEETNTQNIPTDSSGPSFATATEIADSYDRSTTIFNALHNPTEGVHALTLPALRGLSAGATSNETQVDAKTYSDLVDSLFTGVSVQSSTTINLINRQAQFPVVVRNTLPWAIRTTVTIKPSDPRLQVNDSAQLAIPANATATAEIPVEAIGSGDISITYVVSTPQGIELNSTATATVRLRAGWEDALTGAIAIIVGIIFVLGVIRSVKRRQAGAERD